jgi:hypothetical protein
MFKENLPSDFDYATLEAKSNATSTYMQQFKLLHPTVAIKDIFAKPMLPPRPNSFPCATPWAARYERALTQAADCPQVIKGADCSPCINECTIGIIVEIRSSIDIYDARIKSTY